MLSKEISDAELAAQQLRKDLQKEESVLADLDESMKTAEETIKEQDEYLRASQEQLASDIAVSRAGSLSISEICVSGLASLLIPYPYASADHQRQNAHEMEDMGAALYLEDSQCTPEAFMEKLEELINDTQKMIELQNNAKKLVKYDATKNIVNQIRQVMK